jgi:hypothetical protein
MLRFLGCISGFVAIGACSGVADEAPSGVAGAPGSGSSADAMPEAMPETPAVADDIEAMCEKLAALPCGKQKDPCVSDATELLAEAEQKECSREYLALLACAAKSEIICAPNLEIPGCAPELHALDACDPICGGATTPDSCTQGCPGWSVSCLQNGPNLECSCTAGPESGKTFLLEVTCSDFAGWTSATKKQCAGDATPGSG